VCVWKGCKCIREVAAHAKGPATSRPDGKAAFGGLRCLVLQPGNKTLLSGGADGCVCPVTALALHPRMGDSTPFTNGTAINCGHQDVCGEAGGQKALDVAVATKKIKMCSYHPA
jgi:hypothetical protein